MMNVSMLLKRSWTIVLSIASVLFLVLVGIHVCFFVEDLRSWLPVSLYELLQRVYGAG